MTQTQSTTTHLVEGSDINHHGTLFAASAAAWFVEAGFITAAEAVGDVKSVVCRGINSMSFTHPVQAGGIVRLKGCVTKAGTTSLTITIKGEDVLNNREFCEGSITFVTIDEITRKKKPHGIKV